jgi:hypothetical protein
MSRHFESDGGLTVSASDFDPRVEAELEEAHRRRTLNLAPVDHKQGWGCCGQPSAPHLSTADLDAEDRVREAGL